MSSFTINLYELYKPFIEEIEKIGFEEIEFSKDDAKELFEQQKKHTNFDQIDFSHIVNDPFVSYITYKTDFEDDHFYFIFTFSFGTSNNVLNNLMLLTVRTNKGSGYFFRTDYNFKKDKIRRKKKLMKMFKEELEHFFINKYRKYKISEVLKDDGN